MSGRHTSPAAKTALFALISGGVSVSVAADRVGIAHSTAYRLVKGLEGASRTQASFERDEEEQPSPKRFEQLDGGVRDMLKFDGGFPLFCSEILLRRPTPWREDAAKRIVAAIQEPTRSYLVANEPPGSGKSTLWGFDIPVWLACGGGIEDPVRGRQIRMMLGSFAKTASITYVRRIRQLLESPRPYVDLQSGRTAEMSIVQAFGRFRPRQQGVPWRSDELIVEQMENIDLTSKEATLTAVSRLSGFLGSRAEYASWDDLVVPSNVATVEIRDNLAEWFSDQAESRIENGGVLALVGQRLGPADLYRDRMNITYNDEAGVEHRKYAVVKYPAHSDETCDAASGGSHRQWNALPADQGGEGCLLDEVRLPWSHLSMQMQQDPRKYKVLFQQEDTDPRGALIDMAWLTGGVDKDGLLAPGSFDLDRTFDEWPTDVGPCVEYVTVDPSASGWWGIEWWSVQREADPTTGARYRYLIRGQRSHMDAGDLLDWNIAHGRLDGLMEDWQRESVQLAHPISTWVIEGNSAFVQLSQHQSFRKFQEKWGIKLIVHTTGVNKGDLRMGVAGLLPGLYRSGQKRLPRKSTEQGLRLAEPAPHLNYMKAKLRELTEYPESSTSDLVMADWMGEWNLDRILKSAARDSEGPTVDASLPPYLQRAQQALQRTSFLRSCEVEDCEREALDDDRLEENLCIIHAQGIYERERSHYMPRPEDRQKAII